LFHAIRDLNEIDFEHAPTGDEPGESQSPFPEQLDPEPLQLSPGETTTSLGTS
jgi:hypothetical protein